MRQITISRDDRFHKAWPSVARAANGDLVVTYKESDGHLNLEFSNLVVRISQDQGETWGERIVLYEVENPVGDGLLQDAGRICALQDGSLLIPISQNAPRGNLPKGQPYLMRYILGGRTLLFRSPDYGRTWEQSVAPVNIPMISSVRQLRSGVILIGATEFSYKSNPYRNRQIQVLYRSTDNGQSWDGPITVCDHPDFQPSEGDFVELADGTLVCYIRDEDFRDDLPVRTAGLKSFSHDGGLTWDGPYSSGRWLYNGRMSTGLLPNGDVMVTSRLGLGKLRPYFGTFQEEPHRKPELVGFWHAEFPLLHAYIESQADALLRTQPGATYADPLPPSARWFVIDEDLSSHPDFGYSGWVNLPSGHVFVVDYITDDAPVGRTQIRGYILTPDDLSSPNRELVIDFTGPAFSSGPLAGQNEWVHHGGPQEPTVLVTRTDHEQVVRGRAASAESKGELVSTGWIAPTLDASRLEAESVRRDIGPYNLYDEPITISVEHRGCSEFAEVQILDDCQSLIAALVVQGGNRCVAVNLPLAGQSVVSGISADENWLETRFEIRAGQVRVFTRPMDSAATEAWCQAVLPELQVAAALAIKLGGQGTAALRRITVTPHLARQNS